MPRATCRTFTVYVYITKLMVSDGLQEIDAAVLQEELVYLEQAAINITSIFGAL